MIKRISFAIVPLISAVCSGCLEDFFLMPPPEPNGLQVIAYSADGSVNVCPATQIGPRLVTTESRCIAENMVVRTSAERAVQVVGHSLHAGAEEATLRTEEEL